MSYYIFREKTIRQNVYVDKEDTEAYDRIVKQGCYNLVEEKEGHWRNEEVNICFGYEFEDGDKEYYPRIKELAYCIECCLFKAEDFYKTLTDEENPEFVTDTFEYLQENFETDADGVRRILKDYTLEDYVRLLFASDLDYMYFADEEPFTKRVIEEVYNDREMKEYVESYGD